MYKYILTIILILGWKNVSSQTINPIWQKFIGGKGGEGFDDAIVTRDNGIFFAGFTSFATDGPIPPFSLDTLNSNIMIGKLDSNLSVLWVKQFGGTNHEYAFRCAQLPDGGFAVLASTQSKDGNAAGPDSTVGGLWLLRIDSVGNLKWQRRYGQSGGPNLVGGTVVINFSPTSDGGFILLGSSNIAGGDVPFHYTSSPFVQDWLVIKVDSLGNKQWTRVLGGNGDESSGGAAILEGNNGYYLIGNSESRDHDCVDTTGLAGPIPNGAAYILRLNYSGAIEWAKSYGGSFRDGFNDAIWDDRDSTIVITGNSLSNNFMGCSPTPNALRVWVLKVDVAGNVKWSTCTGDGETYPLRITRAPQGYVILGQAMAASHIPTHIGGVDAVVFLISNAGTAQASKIVGSDKDDYLGTAIYHKNGILFFGSTEKQFLQCPSLNSLSSGPYKDGIIMRFELWPAGLKSTLDTVSNILKFYPNPSSSGFTIERTKGNHDQIQYAISDITGRVLIQGVLEKTYSKRIVNTTTLSAGVYSLSAGTPNLQSGRVIGMITIR